MSFNRLRHLAGLNESFTHDPGVNAAIEQRLDQQQQGSRHNWMDMLEIIYHAGDEGISRKEIVDQMYALYPDASREFGSNGLDEMMDTLAERFDNVVKTSEDGNWFAWSGGGEEPDQPHASTQNDLDVEREIDPNVHRAISAQVGMTSQALAMMRQMTQQRGSFTLADLAQHLRRTMQIPPSVAQQFAEHIIGQFQGEITQQNGRYVMRTEEPTSNANTMDFLRGLARKQ